MKNNVYDYKDNTELKEGNHGEEMNARYGVRDSKYDLRPRRMRDYSHLHTKLEHTCMTKYSLKKGLEKFGDAGINAVEEELKQLDTRDAFTPVFVNEMGPNEKRKSLPY
jgi:hypothetical protein